MIVIYASNTFYTCRLSGPLPQGRIDMKRLVDANAAESSKEAIAGTLKSRIIQLLSISQKVQQNQLFLLSVSFSLYIHLILFI